MSYTQKDHEKEREEKLKKGSIKIILLGECGVGKTCLIKAYLKQDFNPNELTSSAIPVVEDLIFPYIYHYLIISVDIS